MDKIVKNIVLNNLFDLSNLSDNANLLNALKLLKKRKKNRKIAVAWISRKKFYRTIPKCQKFFETIFTDPEDIFYNHFRMKKDTFKNFVKMVKSEWTLPKTGRPAYSVERCLYVTLWKLCNQNSFREISDGFGIGMGTAYRLVRKTVKIISKLKSKVIKWPFSEPAQRKVVEEFEKIRTNPFPSVVGCIDGMHVNISASVKDPTSYYNRKGNYSVIVQGVVDSKFRFLDAFVGYPGRCHDASVWRNSPLKNALDEKRITLPVDYHLIGDSAYPLDIHLMVPYRDNGFLTAEEKNFNYSLCSTRVFVEQAFGILKKKFRILNFIDIRNLPYAKNIIMSCIVIHNIILNNEACECDQIDIDFDDDVDLTIDDECYVTAAESSNNEAKRKRELLTTLISA